MIPSLYEKFQHWAEKGSVWLYSDPHFGDEELRAGIPDRPTDEELVKLINSKVGKHDTFICLGDVGDVSYVRKIKGYKVLICGNHDVGASNYQRKETWEKYDVDKYTKEQVIQIIKDKYPDMKRYDIDEEYTMFHSPFIYWRAYVDNGLFDEVYTGPLMISEKILLSHEPAKVDWAYNIHGHVHDKKVLNTWTSYNVCADKIGYVPVSLNSLIKTGIMNKTPTIHRITIDKASGRR